MEKLQLDIGNVIIMTTDIEEKALSQLHCLVEQPAFRNAKVRIMPDVHAGAGCVIGFTADLGTKVIPNIVGVDIGCGMHVVELGKTNLDLEAVDRFIKQNIPSGFAVNNKVQAPFDLNKLYCYNELINVDRLALGIGSLGGGNHFIELDKDENDNTYLVIHTGSRNLGKQVACIYQDKAINYCRNLAKPEIDKTIKDLKAQGRQMELQQAIKNINEKYKEYSVPKELCYLEGDLRNAYLHDMKLCQEYAILNRKIISDKIVKYLSEKFGVKKQAEWESIHNYIDDSNMVRKGAIAAHKGQEVIIPLNMRDGSIIGVGKGNADWNESGPHGAGRLLSRGEAKRVLNVVDFKKSMEGIYSTTVDNSTLDEAPMAYKPADEIIDAVNDTVDIKCIIKPIYNFKAAED